MQNSSLKGETIGISIKIDKNANEGSPRPN